MKILLILLLASITAFGAELSGKKPNIILVITDDQGYGQMGRHGHPWIETPNLDSLYDKSTMFSAFHVSPTCAPTRAALMTGNVPFKNGITHTILERERMALSAVTLPQMLKKAGYTSGIFGKWHLGDEKEYQPESRGFDEVFIHGAGGIGQAYKCSCADAPGNKYDDPVIRHNGKFVKTKGFCTDIFFTQALSWIKQKRDKPFFAYISTNAPHGPFIAPEKNRKKFEGLGFQKKTAGFYGMIENIDENMGRLLKYLKEWKMEENTLVIFMSDNGTTGNGAGRGALGKKDGKSFQMYNASMKGMKGSPNEGGTRVPVLCYWKGTLKEKVISDRLTAHIDILPTLVELAGGEVPKNIDGKSMVPLLENPQADWSDRNLFFHVARWKTGDDPDKHKYNKFGIRNTQYRLINNKELYDISKDPGEKNNIYSQKPEVVKSMMEAYDKWWKEVRPYMVNEDAPMSKTRPYHVWYEEQMNNGGIPAWKEPEL